VAGGAGQVLLGHDGVEDAEQVQVKREEAHGIRSGQRFFGFRLVYPISIHDQYKDHQ
jgi:hypothetical protein